MKALKILSFLFLLLLAGCDGSTDKNKVDKNTEPLRFASSGNMVLGNIFVGELWQKLYKNNKVDEVSSNKKEDEVITDAQIIELKNN